MSDDKDIADPTSDRGSNSREEISPPGESTRAGERSPRDRDIHRPVELSESSLPGDLDLSLWSDHHPPPDLEPGAPEGPLKTGDSDEAHHATSEALARFLADRYDSELPSSLFPRGVDRTSPLGPSRSELDVPQRFEGALARVQSGAVHSPDREPSLLTVPADLDEFDDLPSTPSTDWDEWEHDDDDPPEPSMADPTEGVLARVAATQVDPPTIDIATGAPLPEPLPSTGSVVDEIPAFDPQDVPRRVERGRTVLAPGSGLGDRGLTRPYGVADLDAFSDFAAAEDDEVDDDTLEGDTFDAQDVSTSSARLRRSQVSVDLPIIVDDDSDAPPSAASAMSSDRGHGRTWLTAAVLAAGIVGVLALQQWRSRSEPVDAPTNGPTVSAAQALPSPAPEIEPPPRLSPPTEVPPSAMKPILELVDAVQVVDAGSTSSDVAAMDDTGTGADLDDDVPPAPAPSDEVELAAWEQIVELCREHDGVEARRLFRAVVGAQPRTQAIAGCRAFAIDLTAEIDGPTASEYLEKAHAAYATGDLGRAYLLARNSSRQERSTEALMLMGKAACRLHDLEKASQVRKMLMPPDQRRLSRFCQRKGLRPH